MNATPRPKILAFAGSLREASWNKQLLKIAVAVARDAGAEVEHITLNDHALPILSQDLEEIAAPENLPGLRDLFDWADALMIASPEYNGSLPAVLKNTLDWLSRPAMHGEDYEQSFANKRVAIMSTSPGRMGGSRALKHLREILTILGCKVCTEQVSVASASRSFDSEGQLTDPATVQEVVNLVEQFVAQLRAGDSPDEAQ